MIQFPVSNDFRLISTLPVFTEKDFAAVIRIGVGSKRDEPSKIGRFGRGSLTMYILSSTFHEKRSLQR